MVKVLPRWPWELVVNLTDHRVRRESFADPVDDRLGGNCCVEAIREANRVGRSDTAGATTCDE